MSSLRWNKFAAAARRLGNQLPSVKLAVLHGSATADGLAKLKTQIAELRIQADDLRRAGVKDPIATGYGKTLEDTGRSLDKTRECLETLGPMLADLAQQEKAGRRKSRRQLRDLASERTETAKAITELQNQLTYIVDHFRGQGIQPYRVRQSEVRATIRDRKPPDARSLA